MKKLVALIVARTKEFYRDHGTLGWTLLFPFIVLVGFAYGYSGRQEPVLRFMVTPNSAISSTALQGLRAIPAINILGADSEAIALKKLGRFECDLVISINEASAASPAKLIYSLNQSSDKGKLAERLLIDQINQLPEPRPSLESKPMNGTPIRYADWVLPGLLAMNIMFGSMFGVGYVIVRYRKVGVLKRLRATPLSSFLFLTAQVISRMLLMIVTSFIVVGGAKILIGFKMQGSWIDLGVFLAVCSAAMISLGLIVAARISSEEMAEGVLNMMTWPMIFLSGIWFSIEGASKWVLFGAKLMPLTYVVKGLRAIMIDGTSIGQLMPEMCVLLGLSVLFIAIGSLIFRWR